MRRLHLSRILSALAILGATAAHAADLTVTLPTITAPPGAVVSVPIDVSPNPTPFGIYSLDFRINLNPAVVQSSSSLSDGFLQFWGPAFVNATPSFVAAATGGLLPINTASGRLNTLQLTIAPTAALGTDMPLTFATLRFNELSPTVSVVPGVLRIRGATGVESEWPTGLALAPASPDPVRSHTRLAFTLPRQGFAELTIHGLDGRRIRTLTSGSTMAGQHEAHWNADDDSGRRVAAGVYFARLESGGRHVSRRLVVLP